METMLQAPLIFVGSWNVGGAPPPEDLDLADWLDCQNNPSEIYVLGFQEIVPLNAGNILGSDDSKISERWNDLIRAALNKTQVIRFGPLQGQNDRRVDKAVEFQKIHSSNESNNFRCIVSKQMVGIFLSVWARNYLLPFVRHLSFSRVGCGIMSYLGNKGSVSVRFCLRETSLCFVCSHLASGGKEGDERHRNTDAAEILSRTTFPRGPLGLLPPKILYHDQVIWLGDLNYRIQLPEDAVRSLVERRKWSFLLERDQLKLELMEGHVFQGWKEGVINFEPTYKYSPNSATYYGSDTKRKGQKSRAPAWCDRIIWYGQGLKQKVYNRSESRLSDHRPVKAVFIAEIDQMLRNSKGYQSFSNNCCINRFQNYDFSHNSYASEAMRV